MQSHYISAKVYMQSDYFICLLNYSPKKTSGAIGSRLDIKMLYSSTSSFSLIS
jgi:hypothetical protein